MEQAEIDRLLSNYVMKRGRLMKRVGLNRKNLAFVTSNNERKFQRWLARRGKETESSE